MKKLFMILPLVFLLFFMVGCQDKAAMAELEQFKTQAALSEYPVYKCSLEGGLPLDRFPPCRTEGVGIDKQALVIHAFF